VKYPKKFGIQFDTSEKKSMLSFAQAIIVHGLKMATRKQQAKEDDWNLAGIGGKDKPKSRTRGGGKGRPDFERTRQYLLIESSDEEANDEVNAVVVEPVPTEEEEEEEAGLEEDDDEEEGHGDKKPPASRVILEVKPLQELLAKNCRCPECEGPVEPTFSTTCLETSISLACCNEECGYLFYGDSPAVTDMNNRDNRQRMSDYALNMLYVVGFLGCGDGGTEAGRLLGLLGLPNDTTMERRSFGIIEEKMSPVIKGLTKDILLENLIEEVKATVGEGNAFDLWKLSLDGTIVLDKSNYPKIRVSFDMAWQQRNSGNRYNSMSGHALFVGGYSRKPITLSIKSKICSTCKAWTKKHGDMPPLEHTCYKNFEGSSGAMEPVACLHMTEELYRDYNCVVDLICADDDSSTRALLKWSNANYMKNNNTTEPPQVPITRGPNKGKPHVRPDKGKLSPEVPEPTFVADPNHRKKVLTGELIALDTSKVAEKATMTRMDSTRIGKNFGYMIRCLKDLPETHYCTAGMAVLEHHFDNHEHCGGWCRRKSMTAAQKKESIRYYRCKTKDAKLYKILSDKLERFIAFDRLKEVAHGMDTQVNESFNNTASWFAPKNKVYCGTSSLTNRISMALGINTLGLLEYYKRLFRKLGIVMTRNVFHHFMMKDRTRNGRLEKLKTKEKKKERLKSRHEALKKDEATARQEKRKREGTYKSGINMQGVDGYTQDEIDEANRSSTSNKRRKPVAICPHCGMKGHATKRSTKCLQHTGRAATTNTGGYC
jgi:hypothetical protein